MAAYAKGNPARWWKGRSCGGASRAPASLFISPFRRNVGIFVLFFLVLLFSGFWYAANPARVARLSEVMLERVIGGHVSVRTAHLSWTGTLMISGVDVRTADTEFTPGDDVPVFSAAEIEVRFDWLTLLTGQIAPTQLVATTPVFRPIEDPQTGHWNYERLRNNNHPPERTRESSGEGSATLPVIVIRDARVEWGEIRSGHVMGTGTTHIDGRLSPDPVVSSLYRFIFAQSAPGSGAGERIATSSPASQAAPPVAGGDIGAVIAGMWDVSRNNLTATAENVVITDSLKRGMPLLARLFCEEHQLTGRLTQLKFAFNARDGLSMTARFDSLSMMWMVEPEEGVGMGEDRPAFPLTLNNVSGMVNFLPGGKGLEIKELKGKVLEHDFVANYALHGTSLDAPFDIDLRFPNVDLEDRYPPLFMAFLSSQDLIQRVRPFGHMNISVLMHRDSPREEMHLDGRIEMLDGSIRFAHFPYVLKQMRGLITFDEKSVNFHKVTAILDDNAPNPPIATIDGRAGTTWTNRFIDFTVSTSKDRPMAFDDRFAACLPERFIPVWNSFGANLKGSFVCRVTQGNSIWAQPVIVMDVDLVGGSAKLDAFPYEFRQIKGQLHLEADESHLEHLTAVTGKDNSGHVSIDGYLRHPGGDLTDITNLVPDLQINADVPLEPALVMALPEEVGSRLKDIDLGGRLTFAGDFRREVSLVPGTWEAVGTMQLSGKFTWKDGTLATVVHGTPLKLRDIAANVDIKPNDDGASLDIRRLEGSLLLAGLPGPDGGQQTAHIATDGKIILNADGMKATLNVAAQTHGTLLPETAPAYFPQSWRDFIADFHPAGALDLQATTALRINGGVGHENKPLDLMAPVPPPIAEAGSVAIDSYDVTLSPQGLKAGKSDWPEPLTRMFGSVHIHPDTTPQRGAIIEMKEMRGMLGVIDLSWSGQIHTTEGRWTLAGDAVSHGLPEKWLSALPKDLADIVDKQHKGTLLQAHLEKLNRDGDGKPWEFAGKLTTQELAVTSPLLIIAGKAELSAAGTFLMPAGGKPGALDFAGTLSGGNVLVSDHLLETLATKVEVSAKEQAIRFTEIEGHVAGGVLSGQVEVYTGLPADTAPATQAALGGSATTQAMRLSGGYDAQLKLDNADFSHLVLPATATDDDRKKMGTGQINATFSLRDIYGDNQERAGEGTVTLRNGNLYDVPVAMGLMQIATFRLPTSRNFNTGDIHYTISGDTVSFDKIVLQSPGIDLAGTGTVSLAKDHPLNLTFITQTPEQYKIQIPIISIITGLLQFFQNNLLVFEVKGPANKPDVSSNFLPLWEVSHGLRDILPRPEPGDSQTRP